jgi:phosphoglycerate kinase
LIDEVTALSGLASDPKRPCVFLLGGLKISDAFSMMEKVLTDGTADRILTTGITANVMLIARSVDLGTPTTSFINDRSLDAFIPRAAELLEAYGDRIEVPTDLAFDEDGERREVAVADLPTDHLLIDVGSETVAAYEAVIADAATLFVNGPAGVYESAAGEYGTRSLWEAVAASDGYSVIGGGDTVASARRFVDPDDIGFISTGGGALIRFLSGQPLPLIDAMERAALRTP